ncbi:PhzF family phenazine biosynthesis protein [Streptomyces sp. NPDC059818]|uniref:PhzF family phenazine biosynthesis protein n=1 Tax=Streptomyces sp. NPDC059818 TaxID=3346962 RepID=UPI003658C985
MRAEWQSVWIRQPPAAPRPERLAPRPARTERNSLTMRQYVVADAFTDRPLEGNPVAVYLEAADLTAHQMQGIAREMNLSETTFVLPPEHGGHARIRIFTPVNELPFAGHPMLGTAQVLGEEWQAGSLLLETAMGRIPVELERTGDRITRVRMRQPIPTWEPYRETSKLLAALGLRDSTLPVDVYCNGPRHVLVGLPSVAALAALRPDHRALTAFPDMAVNCFAGSGSIWRTRMFSPAYGVVEDAATGSASGPLAIHLARHGLIEDGTEIEIVQGAWMGRPSTMYARATREGSRVTSVEMSGSAVTVARGTLLF